MKKNSNKLWKIILIAVATIALSLVIAKKAGWIGGENATAVELSKVETDDLTQVVSASGKVQPEVEVKISPDVSGEIIGLYVQEGDSVQKGQLLLKIQPENYVSMVDRFKAGVDQSRASAEQAKSSITSAESRLVKAQTEFNRQQQLYNDKVVSQADYQTAEANLIAAKQELASARANYDAAKYGIRSAEASLKDASENLRKTNIYAPVSGTISKLGVELGERVVGTSQMAGTELLRIANLNNMEVRVNVNENDIVDVDLGDKVLVDVDTYSDRGKKFEGVVTRMANTALGSGGSLDAAATSANAVTEFEVRIKILPESYSDLKKDKKFPFRPGMTATVDIITQKKTGVLTLPISAVTTRSDNSGTKNDTQPTAVDEEKPGTVDKPKEVVFVNDNGVALKKEVSTGITDITKGKIEIISGLQKGEEVISGPYIEVSKNLKDGVKVVDKNLKAEKKK